MLSQQCCNIQLLTHALHTQHQTLGMAEETSAKLGALHSHCYSFWVILIDILIFSVSGHMQVGTL
jgi:hypothetical protein